MKDVEEAVRTYLQRAAGVSAVVRLTRCQGAYPLLAVSAREEGITLVDGGRQAEHRYRVTVTAAADREREKNGALLSSLPPLLLRGVPMGRRVLHPLDIQTQGEQLTFALEVCLPLPEEPGGGTAAEPMAALHWEEPQL